MYVCACVQGAVDERDLVGVGRRAARAAAPARPAARREPAARAAARRLHAHARPASAVSTLLSALCDTRSPHIISDPPRPTSGAAAGRHSSRSRALLAASANLIFCYNCN